MSGYLSSPAAGPFRVHALRSAAVSMALAALLTAVLAVLYQPSTTEYETLDTPASSAEVRAYDASRLATDYGSFGFDSFTYFAMARGPQGDPYLSQRAPFRHRVLVPFLVRVASPWVEPILAFRAVVILACWAQLVAWSFLARSFGILEKYVLLGLTTVALTPVFAGPMTYFVSVDSAVWALLLASWWSARTRGTLLTGVLLAGAVLAHEVAVFMLPVLLFELYDRRPRDLARLFVPLLTAGISFLLPRLLAGGGDSPALGVRRILETPGREMLHNLAETVFGAGPGIGLVLLAIPTILPLRRYWSRLAVPWIFGVLVVVLPITIGRFMAPAGAACSLLVADLLTTRLWRRPMLMAGSWAGAALAVTVAWPMGWRPAHVAAAVATALFMVGWRHLDRRASGLRGQQGSRTV